MLSARAVQQRHGEAPEQDFEHAWKATGESIRNRLRLGFDVLLHCRGGLGRAGTIAARLLVELGVQPDDAIRACATPANGPSRTTPSWLT